MGVGRDVTAKTAWTVVLVLSSLLIGNPFVLVLLLPVLVGFWLLSHSSTHAAGALLTLAHVCLAVVVATADAPDENRAFAPLTLIVVDVVALAGCALLAPAFRRRRDPSHTG